MSMEFGDFMMSVIDGIPKRSMGFALMGLLCFAAREGRALTFEQQLAQIQQEVALSAEGVRQNMAAPQQGAIPPAHEIKNLIRVPMQRHGTSYTCGVAALQSVLYYYNSQDPELRWVREDKLMKEMKTTEDGTDYENIVAVARAEGLRAEPHLNMTLEQLESAIDRKNPVICAIQAWSDTPGDYQDKWDDGHYVVAIGYDQERLYFMDPSTMGNYTYITKANFLKRWHDEDRGHVKVIGLGIIFSKDAKPGYDPDLVLELE